MYDIEVENLKRDFVIKTGLLKKTKKTVNAVRGVSFNVKRGEVFGLLGQNGAGKTTTIKILTTMLAPSSGICKVLGYDTFGQEKLIRSRINFIFGGEYGLYRRLSAKDNLRYFGNLYKIPHDIRDRRISELFELVGLSDKDDLRVETYSKGMIQRVQIARGLINNPEVLFLDEPTIGLDPIGAEMMRETIKQIKSRGTTVLLTTHNMYEADDLCDRIAIINEGVFLALDTPMGIKSSAVGDTVLTFELTKSVDDIKSKIISLQGVIDTEEIHDSTGFKLRVVCDSKDNTQNQLLSIIEPTLLKGFSREAITLEDAYIKLIRGSI